MSKCKSITGFVLVVHRLEWPQHVECKLRAADAAWSSHFHVLRSFQSIHPSHSSGNYYVLYENLVNVLSRMGLSERCRPWSECRTNLIGVCIVCIITRVFQTHPKPIMIKVGEICGNYYKCPNIYSICISSVQRCFVAGTGTEGMCLCTSALLHALRLAGPCNIYLIL